MSHASVYIIQPNGDVASIADGDVRNAMAGAWFIWSTLSKKLGHRLFRDEELIWKEFLGGRLTREEDICLGFTFDASYVKRENIGVLASALEWFDVKYCAGIVQTIKGIAVILRRLERATTFEFRGVCFQQTSSSDHPWRLRDPDDAENSRYFNFDRDTHVIGGSTPFELIERVNEKYK